MNTPSQMHQYLSLMYANYLVSKTDLDGRITYVNDRFCEISGYEREELLGNLHNIIRHPDNSNNVYIEIWDTIKHKRQVWNGVITNKRQDNSEYTVKVSIAPIFDEKGDILEFLSIGDDITEIERAKIQINESFEKLQELDRQKDDFINIASHELRTPLTSVKGYLSMMVDGDIGTVDQTAKEALGKVSENINKMINMINDMLDISKIESGKMQFDYERCNMKTFLLEYIDEIQGLFHNKDLHFKHLINYEECGIIVDKFKLKQILNNLMGNAIKFTPALGEVTLYSYYFQKKLFIVVRDTGIGIEKENLPKIFEKFGQAHDSFSRNIGGTGLGIPIVVQLVKCFGGELFVKSRVGKGSEFKFYLPL